MDAILKWTGCNCHISAFQTLIAQCTSGVVLQMVGVALAAFSIGASIYHERYWWIVGQAAKAELDRIFN